MHKHVDESLLFIYPSNYFFIVVFVKIMFFFVSNEGTVRRSTDGDFIHANVDIDLIISEEPEYGSLEKPVEIFHISEHFCLGM